MSSEKPAVADDLLLVSPCEVDKVALYAEVSPAMRLDVFPFGIIWAIFLAVTGTYAPESESSGEYLSLAFAGLFVVGCKGCTRNVYGRRAGARASESERSVHQRKIQKLWLAVASALLDECCANEPAAGLRTVRLCCVLRSSGVCALH